VRLAFPEITDRQFVRIQCQSPVGAQGYRACSQVQIGAADESKVGVPILRATIQSDAGAVRIVQRDAAINEKGIRTQSRTVEIKVNIARGGGPSVAADAAQGNGAAAGQSHISAAGNVAGKGGVAAGRRAEGDTGGQRNIALIKGGSTGNGGADGLDPGTAGLDRDAVGIAHAGNINVQGRVAIAGGIAQQGGAGVGSERA